MGGCHDLLKAMPSFFFVYWDVVHLSHLPEGMCHVMGCSGVNLGVLDVDLMFPSTAKLSDC